MKPSRNIDRLLEIMAALRDPETGCPWDVEQNFQSIVPYTLEETYEVLDAIERNDMDDLREELGDLLLQVVFHSRMAEEQGSFAFGDVVEAITRKMIRRHPHVFGDAEARGAGMAKGSWNRIKAEEKAERAERRSKLGLETTEKNGFLDDIPQAFPALLRALKLQQKAAKVGFDWSEAAPILDKIAEETAKLKEAMAAKERADIEEEYGDLLFAMVNLGRHLEIDAETALVAANEKFRRRFHFIEKRLGETGSDLNSATLDEMEAIWGGCQEKGTVVRPSFFVFPFWAEHLIDAVRRGEIHIAKPADGSGFGNIDETVCQNLFIDMDADHFSNHHVIVGQPTLLVLQTLDLYSDALKRGIGFLDARRCDKPASRPGETRIFKLADAPRRVDG